MENKVDIIEGSKRIAEFMGLKYIPFNDLQDFPKPGWWEVHSNEPKIYELRIDEPAEAKDFKILKLDTNKFKYTTKKGYISTSKYYAKFICRNHSDLRYYNDTDLLLTVVNKIGGRLNITFDEVKLYAGDEVIRANYTKLPLLRQALFEVVVEYLSEIIKNNNE